MMGIVLREGLALYPQGFPPEILEPFAPRDRRPGRAGQQGRQRHGHHRGAGAGAPAHRQAHRLHLGRLGLPDRRPRGDSPARDAVRLVPRRRGGCSTATRGARDRPARSWGRPGSTGAPTTGGTSPWRRRAPTVLERLVGRRGAGGRRGQDPGRLRRQGHHRRDPHRGERRRAAPDRGAARAGGPRPALRQPGGLRQPLRPPQRPRRATPARWRSSTGRCPRILGKLRPGELCAITADHGCDPDHPLHRSLARVRAAAGPRAGARWRDLGTRASFADLGATVADYFGLRAEVGASFLGELHR